MEPLLYCFVRELFSYWHQHQSFSILIPSSHCKEEAIEEIGKYAI